MSHRLLIGAIFACLWGVALPARAVEYRLQVTSLDYLTFASYLESSSRTWGGEEPMGRLEARLDRKEFPTGAVIPGREVRLLDVAQPLGVVKEVGKWLSRATSMEKYAMVGSVQAHGRAAEDPE